MKKVTVIIACHNSEIYLDRCWNSLKNQTIGIDNLECIFVDDASTDNGATYNKLIEIEDESPDSVVIIHLDTNMRQGGARNVALSYATGEYLMFLDSDDELELTACEKLFFLAEDMQLDIIQFEKNFIINGIVQSTGECRETCFYAINSVDDRKKLLLMEIMTCGALNKFYKMSIIKETQAFFAENIVYEEPPFVYPHFFYVNRIYVTQEVLYKYHIHPGSTVTSEIGKRVLEHPLAQIKVLEWCIAHRDFFETYKNEIEMYFIWSFWVETILFTGRKKGAYMPLEFIIGMQKICENYFPNYKKNPYILKIEGDRAKLLQTIDKKFVSQQDVDLYIKEYGQQGC